MKREVNEVLDRDCIQIFTDGDTKYIHFLGYAWYVDNDVANPFRILEYCGNIVPISEWIGNGREKSDECNEFFNNGHCAYISDCNEEEVLEYYGDLPILKELITENTPDGEYII